jgi:hypothetical protein
METVMKLLTILLLCLIPLGAMAQKKPIEPKPTVVMRCATLEDTQEIMRESGFVKRFMGKIGPKLDVIIWYNEEKGVIMNTTIQEINGVHVMCISGPPVFRVREFGPV